MMHAIAFKARPTSSGHPDPAVPRREPVAYPQVISRKQRIHMLIAEIARRHGVTYAEITSDGRFRYMTWPRHMAMLEIRRQYGLSYPHIGAIFGRDHASCVTAVHRMQARLVWVEILKWAAKP